MIQCRKQGNVGVLVGMSTGGVGKVTFQIIGQCFVEREPP